MDNMEKIFDKEKDIKLSTSEKEKMRSFIVSYMKSGQDVGAEKGLFMHVFYAFGRAVPALAIITLVVASGAGISLAAENSLPGDLLYPVKVSINEEIKEKFARTDEDKVRWLVAVAERRIEETEKLASENRLDAKASATIEANFSKNAEKIKERLNSSEGKENLTIAADVTSRLETSLVAHEEILEKIASESESKAEVTFMLNNIKSVSKSVKETRKNFEDRVLGKQNGQVAGARQARFKASVESIGEAREALKKARNSIDKEVKERAEELIKEAEEIVEVSSSNATSSQNEILSRLHDAVKLSSQAKLMLEAQSRLKIKFLEFGSRGEDRQEEQEEESEEGEEDQNQIELEINSL